MSFQMSSFSHMTVSDFLIKLSVSEYHYFVKKLIISILILSFFLADDKIELEGIEQKMKSIL